MLPYRAYFSEQVIDYEKLLENFRVVITLL